MCEIILTGDKSPQPPPKIVLKVEQFSLTIDEMYTKDADRWQNSEDP